MRVPSRVGQRRVSGRPSRRRAKPGPAFPTGEAKDGESAPLVAATGQDIVCGASPRRPEPDAHGASLACHGDPTVRRPAGCSEA